jgi:hypothetical protein
MTTPLLEEQDMADEHGRWIVREIADILATATEHGRRRSTGERLPLHEFVQLQRRKVTLLCAIAQRSPSARGIHQAVDDVEAQLTDMLAEAPPASSPFTTLDARGPKR